MEAALDKKAPLGYNRGKGAKMTLPPHISRIVEEYHCKRRSHQKPPNLKKGKPFKCDIPGCKMKNTVPVLRALSHKFKVHTKKKKKVDLNSQIVVAEVRIKDYPNKKAARKALIQILDNRPPLDLKLLCQIKRPLEHGYTKYEVYSAIMPYIQQHTSHYFTLRFDFADGLQQGFLGLDDALRTDRAISPFAGHAFRAIQTQIRRKSAQCGIIKHGERDNDFYGTKGGQIGFRWACHDCGYITASEPRKKSKRTKNTYICESCGKPDAIREKVFSGVQSTDAPLADDFRLIDILKSRENLTPMDEAIRREVKDNRSALVDLLLAKADFTEQQMNVFVRIYGLKGHKAKMGSEVAKELGLTRQRIGQQKAKCEAKIKEMIARLGLKEEDYF